MIGKNNSSRPLVADAEDAGKRLDLYLAAGLADLSRSLIQKLIVGGHVSLNDQVCCDKNYRLKPGDRIEVRVPPPEEIKAEPEAIRLDIIYEDEDLLVINKPRGMVVHPAPGHDSRTLVNALLNHCRDLSGIGGAVRPGIVHRLDKDTSGLLIVAKNDFTHQALSKQLKERKLSREYLALVRGRVRPERGHIEAPIGRHPRHRKKMAVIAEGREAVTRYRVIKYYGPYSLLQVNLETGRTHQIRVHLAHLGFPVVGDPTYARSDWKDLPPELAVPQALHARRIRFAHPRTGQFMVFAAPLPEEFKKGLIRLRIGQEK